MTTKSHGRSKRKPAAAKAGRKVTVRMYNVGFGDAFLVQVPDGDRQRRILFDCGSIEAAEGITMARVVDRIVADVTDEDGVARIDVVVGTHRHKDHVSGFGNARWAEVEVKEVWMPWTEDPADEEARRIRNIQSSLALGLNAALAAQNANAAAAPNAARCRDIVANALALTNDKEMKTLHSGFAGHAQRRFLPARSGQNRSFTTPALPGVTVHVLGPSRQRDVIRDMDPPKGESYLRLRAASGPGGDTLPAPFPGATRHDTQPGIGSLTVDDMSEIQAAGSLSDFAVAVALDKAVNGTSLMLILEVAGSYLLFPGDAQWGTWSTVLADPEWKEMLQQLAFYKIGHHGSHNATPKDFVQQVAPMHMCCMASTLTRRIWPDIPRMPLLIDLAGRKKASIARSDQEDEAGKPFRADNGLIEVQIDL